MINVIGTVCSTDNNEFRDKLSEVVKEIQNNNNDAIIDIKYSTCMNTYGNIEYSALIIGK